MLGLAVLYRYGPSRDTAQWAWVTPGSLVAAVLWLVASLLFSWYASNFGSYNETYGSLGAVIGFMTWIWLSAIVVLLGAEINAETEHQTAHDTTDGPPADGRARRHDGRHDRRGEGMTSGVDDSHHREHRHTGLPCFSPS